MSATQRWDEFIAWARQFYEWTDFEKEERANKQMIATRLLTTRDALLGGDDGWAPLLTSPKHRPLCSIRRHSRSAIRWALL